MAGRDKTVAMLSLLSGAVVWGLIWYPYRMLEYAGLSGLRSTILSYLVALVLGILMLQKRVHGDRPTWILLPIGVSSAACNLGYVLAMLQGEVMKVLLLFYLAPLWTVLWSRLLLKEKLTKTGMAVIALSLGGAVTMLWRPALGAPWPASAAEWLGMAAGFLFALSNVLVRQASDLSIEIKSLAVFASVVVLGSLALPFEPTTAASLTGSSPWQAGHWLLLALLGVILLVINLVVQHGLTHTSANQAIVIFLFELVVAALSSWLLADEIMGVQEWLGGTMIIAASLFSGKMDKA